jgi:hypothetical protein
VHVNYSLRSARALLACLASVLLATSAYASVSASTPPALTLSDNYGNSVAIDSTGAITCAGSGAICNPATASPGSVTWSGTIGIFNISVAGGQSKPALPSAQINLDLRITTGAFGAGGATSATLNAKWSDVGFTGTGPTIMTATSSISGSVSATYIGYVDKTNTLFGAGTTVGAIGPITSSSTTTVTGPGLTSAPFSMTATVAATMGPNSSFTLSGLSLMASPVAPLILGCATASGQAGVPYSSNLSATGGLPPYSFSISGSLPPGLTLDPSSGEIGGTPNTPGAFSFTPEVIDSSGNPEQSTVQSQCSIAITSPPGPLALACPAPNDEEGIRYSSSLVATGDTPPYTFSITSGSLPPGLSLNPASGAISGIDTTATGSFPFTARVAGSGNGAANTAMINCLVMAAAQKLKMVAAAGTTPQTVVVGRVLGKPLAVVVTDADTGKPVAGVTVTFTATIKPQNIPSGAFAGGMNNDLNTMNSVDVDTDKNGLATAPTFTANGVLGNYTVIARLAGVPSVNFKLTNLVGPPVNIKITAGDGQTSIVGTQFKNALKVNVTDGFGNPVPNWAVSFSAPIVPSPGLPGPAPTAKFVSNNSYLVKVNTDQAGDASSGLVKANTVPSSYVIKAQVFVPLPPSNTIYLVLSANFKMTNVAGPPAKISLILPANDPTVVPGPPVELFAKVNTKYIGLVAQVTDAFDNPLAGQSVRFRSANGPMQAGATFAGPSSRLGIICTPPATKDDGIAAADPLTANGSTGAFFLLITVANTNLKETFKLVNRDTLTPDMVGKTQAAATTAITGATLKLGKVTTQSSNTVAAGNVISQDPPAGMPINFGDKVDLTVSSGKPKP